MKRVVILSSVIVAAVVIAATITVLLVLHQASVDAKKAACARYPVGSAPYFLCIDRAG